MKEYLQRLPEELLSCLHHASDVAEASGAPAFLVGGCVRDLLLHIGNLDLDIAVEGDGILFADALAKRLAARLVCHHRFKTATILVSDHRRIDIATSRRETYAHPGSLPHVIPGSISDDLFRRDFTVNAMAVSLSKHDFGRLIDLYDGKADLAHKKIRILHDKSFIDDPTRMIRAVRFEQRLDFSIEPRTLHLFKEAAAMNVLTFVQPQRLRDELVKVLKERQCWKPLKRLALLEGLAFISPYIRYSDAMSDHMKQIDAACRWFYAIHRHVKHLDVWVMYFMALTHALDDAGAKQLGAHLVLRASETRKIAEYRRAVHPLNDVLGSNDVKPSSVFEHLAPLSYEAILVIYAYASRAAVRKHIEDYLERHHSVRTHISGEQLQELGLPPGRAYQTILRRILHARLDGRVHSRDDEMALAKKLIGSGKPSAHKRGGFHVEN